MTSVQRRATAAVISPEEEFAEGIKGLILDCDGVLFDSKEANTAYYNHIRFAVQLPPMSEDEAAYSHMASTEEALERMIPEELKEQARLAREDTRYHDTFMALMQPASHVYAFLKIMKNRGVPMALCTNRSDSVLDVLAHFGMESFFAPVMTITHARPKPDPEGLTEIVRIWGAAPGTLAFLGDSLVDQQAAAAAGIPFWSFASPDLNARLHVTNFKELTEIMEIMLMR